MYSETMQLPVLVFFHQLGTTNSIDRYEVGKMWGYKRGNTSIHMWKMVNQLITLSLFYGLGDILFRFKCCDLKWEEFRDDTGDPDLIIHTFLLSEGGTCSLLLVSRICQKWWTIDYVNVIFYQHSMSMLYYKVKKFWRSN